jgi:DnaJ-class molecular chaperone
MTTEEAAKVLNVDVTSHPDVILKSYRKLDWTYNPEYNYQPGAAHKYAEVNKAFITVSSYRNLSEKEQRKLFGDTELKLKKDLFWVKFWIIVATPMIVLFITGFWLGINGLP